MACFARFQGLSEFCVEVAKLVIIFVTFKTNHITILLVDS